MFQLFMIPLGFALDMMLLLMSSIISLGLVALLLGLGTPGAPKINICPPNMRITSILTIIVDISVVYGPIELCFGHDTPVGVCCHISRAHDPIIRCRGP